jgi:hypothetical protein
MSFRPRRLTLDLEILHQPDDSTCGATCLQAVYRYYGDDVDLSELIAGIPQLEAGGTLASNLGIHALRRGYRALIYTYNLAVFDPTWFQGESCDLVDKLERQSHLKRDARLAEATTAYVQYLELGGELTMVDLSAGLLRRWLQAERPILTGLSSTYLYRSAREVGHDQLVEDDVRGVPTGHFVVLSGWDEEERTVRVADPVEDNPHFQKHIYWVPVQRLINAILLGVLTYDGNLLVLEPPGTCE